MLEVKTRKVVVEIVEGPVLEELPRTGLLVSERVYLILNRVSYTL